MLGDGIEMGAAGLPAPARHPRQGKGDIVQLDVEGRGVQKVDPTARQQTLPDPDA